MPWLGAHSPKSELTLRLADLEEAVRDAILEEETEDQVLALLINIATSHSGLITGNIMTEPSFFHLHFRRWVKEGLAELSNLHNTGEKAPTSE